MRKRLGLRLAALLMLATAIFGSVACSGPQQRGGGDKEQSDQGSKDKSSDKSSDDGGDKSSDKSSDGGSDGGSSDGGSSDKSK